MPSGLAGEDGLLAARFGNREGLAAGGGELAGAAGCHPTELRLVELDEDAGRQPPDSSSSARGTCGCHASRSNGSSARTRKSGSSGSEPGSGTSAAGPRRCPRRGRRSCPRSGCGGRDGRRRHRRRSRGLLSGRPTALARETSTTAATGARMAAAAAQACSRREVMTATPEVRIARVFHHARSCASGRVSYFGGGSCGRPWRSAWRGPARRPRARRRRRRRRRTRAPGPPGRRRSGRCGGRSSGSARGGPGDPL